MGFTRCHSNLTFSFFPQGDLIIPTHQDVLRREEKNEQMLDEFCRKRSDIGELQTSSVLNIKRVKTAPDGSMTAGGGGGPDGNGKSVSAVAR